MTIRSKLFACLAALALSIVLLATLSFWSMSTNKTALDSILQDRLVPMRDLKTVADKYAVDIVDASHKARNGNFTFAQSAAKVRDGSENLHKHWKAYRATQIDGEEAALATEAETRMRVADEHVAELLTILNNGDRAALDGFVLNKLYQSIDPVSDSIGKLVNLQLKIAENTGNAATHTARMNRTIMIALVLGGIAVLVMSLIIISSKVVAPIQRLAETIRGLASQNGTADVPHLDQKDEIGDIARSVDVFRQSVVRAEQEKAVAAAQATEALATGLAALAEGDLTFQLEQDFPPAYAKLQSDFNEAAASLRNALRQVTESASGINSGANDIRQASDDLSKRTEQQAASLEETAAAMDEITSTVRSTAERANRADTAVRDARDEAERSGGVVRRAVDAMGGIERTSNEISEIISVIDGIAFQTNLLALNAGVEAARAGDAGKGFAVVASEVRALAQRSAEAAKDVKARITASSVQVTAGVQLVGETGEALERIIGKIGEINGLVSAIAASAEQQATGLQQVNTAVSEMDGVTQKNAAMVEEATAAARSLASEVDGMSLQIARFRVGNAPVASASPVHDLQHRAATAARRIAKATPPRTAGNTALAVSEDEWSEF
ncbi:HAMP domain-containing methyl-accepting chemotaxis protein [uncultured Sphingomonas sp.]|uniref:HAMP domain-containing methyl-accepting chemotaxis protein n=1 Tax=uncultured Sphingomonas sp. TaxID=158754 RepID=UPI0025D75271|nr:HAMP domain-containing methyl-accepting chemotaxis protein [uncultured Sphingomonas sp.]